MQLIKGDITNETTGLIVHGTNCSGGFGSGVAGAIRKKWPQVYEAFHANGIGKRLLGTLDIIKIDENLYIGNAYTQEKYGYDGKRYASPSAVELALLKAFEWCQVNEMELKAPKIASDRGGLDWEHEVKPLFEQFEQKIGIESKIYYI